VVAIQHGEQIFNMTASFQVTEDGFDHQIDMPQVPPPESLPDPAPAPELLDKLPEKVRRFFSQPRPFEFRLVQPVDYLKPRPAPPLRQIWVRAVGKVGDGEMLHRRLLAYVSDFFLLDTATLPHGTSFLRPTLIMATIDHAMWFHRPLRVDDWLLCAMDSPSASGARGFARASIFARDGRLVASAAQEGLIRQR
jgi:acyl-CoA thioesterase-2